MGRNPMLQQLSGNQQNKTPDMASLMRSKNPGELYAQLMQSSPQFRSFVQKNQGKSWEQIAQENNVNPDIVRRLMKR